MFLPEENLQQIFIGIPAVTCLIKPNYPDFTLVAVSKTMADFTKLSPEDWIGSPFFNSFFTDSDLSQYLPKVIEAIQTSIQEKKTVTLKNFRFDTKIAENQYRELFWDISFLPIINKNNEIQYIQVAAENVTDQVVVSNSKELKKSLEMANKLIQQTGIAIHILEGPNHIIKLANIPTLRLWDEDNSVINKPFFEVLPELLKSDFPKILYEVLNTGTPFIANEIEVNHWKIDKHRSGFFNIVIQPYYDNIKAKATGVVCMVSEVSELHHSRRELAQEKQSMALASELGDLGVFNIDPESKTIECSPQIVQWFGFPSSIIPLEEAMLYIHPSDMEMVNRVYVNIIKGSSAKHNIMFRTRPNANGNLKFLRSVGKTHVENDRVKSFSGVLQDVSAKVESELIIENALRRQEQIIKSAPLPMAVFLGGNMAIEMANESMVKMWGKGKKVFGKSYFDLLPELKSSGIFSQLKEVYNSGKSYSNPNCHLELVVNGKKQSYYLNFTLTPLRDVDGKVYGVLNTAADVTDVNMAKNALEESKNQYRFLFDESSVAAALYMGEDFKIQYANTLMLRYWMTDESVIGKALKDIVPEPRKEQVLKILRQVYSTGQNYNGFQEKVVYDHPGAIQEYYMNYSFKAIKDAYGKVIGIHYLATDVTAEFQIKKALIESEANLRNMIMQAPFAICILWGNQYVMGNVNPMMQAILEKPLKEIEGKTLFEAVPEMNTPEMQILLERCYNGERIVINEAEFQFNSQDQINTVFLKYHYEPMRDADGMTQGIMVLAIDVTQEVSARQKIKEIVSNRTRELAETNQRLQQSNAELEQFAYIASHDLQEPLRKISMFTQMLEASLELVDERSIHHMERINNSVTRMSNLIQDILTYSQLSHRMDIFLPIDLNRVIKEVQLDFDQLLQDKKGQIILKELPIIDGVPPQMHQLFSNLISNSLKYSRANEAPIIRISSRKLTDTDREKLRLPSVKQGYITITIKDNGIGFQQEYADKIFQIFQRLHSKTQYEGTGIGLAMCKKIVENHRGLIYAIGSEGEGAEFRIILPIQQN